MKILLTENEIKESIKNFINDRLGINEIQQVIFLKTQEVFIDAGTVTLITCEIEVSR